MQIQAWRVHDSGLVAAPGPFRRLPGAVRHHQGRGAPWPDRVVLAVEDRQLVVEAVGSWPLAEVSIRRMSEGPPVSFVIEVAGASHLLAAPADGVTAALLAALDG